MKITTQQAPLEKFLSYLRYKRTIEFIRNKKVIDFGCGISFWNEKFIGKYPKLIHGVDSSFLNLKSKNYPVEIYSKINDLPLFDYDVVLSMAVFEHIRPFVLIDILDKLANKTSKNAIIFGTTPTPYSRPILEILSYKLKLIDESQIRDHKVYYDDFWLKNILLETDWKLKKYKTFQFGLNSEFILIKK
ncbi:class I SAM-dependent methyltransferase [Prochlorococcus sp. AH-716-B04]|nr:class I SAM-dependent methyltransferase [Prochlorococcus sp. AH-716-B04]